MTSRAEWLASLKVGDTVGVLDRQNRRRGWIGKIARFTKARKIWVGDDNNPERTCFTPDGDSWPVHDYGDRLQTVEHVAAFNERCDERDEFIAAVERLYLLRHGGSKGFDFVASTAIIQSITTAIIGRKP